MEGEFHSELLVASLSCVALARDTRSLLSSSPNRRTAATGREARVSCWETKLTVGFWPRYFTSATFKFYCSRRLRARGFSFSFFFLFTWCVQDREKDLLKDMAKGLKKSHEELIEQLHCQEKQENK